MPTSSVLRTLPRLWLPGLAVIVSAWAPGWRPSSSPLRIEQVAADSTAFDVVATLVIGPRHVLLWDAQYHLADAERVADAIARSGKPLQAIVLSHADEDHISGVGAIVKRFPGTPVYLTRAALAMYDSAGRQRFKMDKAQRPALFPDSLAAATVLPSNRIMLDGEVLELIPDLQGDVLAPSNSALWIPSLRTVLAGDIVFNGVHPWLGSSDSTSRVAWRGALQRLAALKPQVVIAGHKREASLPDSPALLQQMDRYLADFDSLRRISRGPKELRDAILAAHPELAVQMLVGPGAAAAYRRPKPAPGGGVSPSAPS